MLAEKIVKHKPDFNTRHFIDQIEKKVGSLELKDRVELIADELHTSLGLGYEDNLAYLMKIMGPENEEETGMFTNFYWIMPVAKYVEKYGLDHYDISLQAIAEITKRNTSEYCIRPFIEKYPDKTLAKMRTWAQDENVHLRRLASEGGRPRLPWATKIQRFIDDPEPLFHILDQLKNDSSKYVQKSVANCLNDILKDNYSAGKDFINTWLPSQSKANSWIIRHALRKLKKSEDSWALEVLDNLKT